MGKRIKTSGASEFFKQLDEDARRGVAALNGLLEDPLHRTGRAVAAAELDGDTVKTLDFKGVLHRIVDGWYYVDEPGRWEWDDPMPWKMAFWHFVAAYLDGKYGERWCLGADDSLMFRAENGVFPHELTVRTPDDETHAVSLPWGYELLVIKASIPRAWRPRADSASGSTRWSARSCWRRRGSTTRTRWRRAPAWPSSGTNSR